jgi:AbrB family looped-hinge helix DNA binding protein
MTQKGQVTIPVEVRRRLGLKPRDRVRFEIDGDEVKITASRSQLLAGYGAVRPRSRPEKWKQVQAKVEEALAREVAREA